MNAGIDEFGGSRTHGGNGARDDERDPSEELAAQASAQLEHARLVFDDLNGRALAFIRERPGTCLLGALALGFVVGKIASRD